MMESSYEIARLCESWWEKLADNAKVDQHRFAQELLALLGWNDVAPLTSQSANLESQLAHTPTIIYILRGSAHSPVAAHFVMPGSLEPPGLIVKRGLDLCETTRTLVSATRSLQGHYAFITDLYRSYLYDVRTEELLLHADTPAKFRREFVDVLTREPIERGALDEIRRQPRSYVARQLREWCHHWNETFMAEMRLSEESSLLAIDRLLVLRYLFDHDILKRTGWRLRQRYSDLIEKVFSDDSTGSGKELTMLFHDIWFDWKASVFAPEPKLDATLEKDVLAASLLKELALHSCTKFGIATILESFNYGEAAEKARVRMVPDENEERETQLAKQTSATIDAFRLELDLEDEGYRAIFYWFEKLIALYDRLEIEFDSCASRTEGLGQEMDLFAWSEMAAKEPQALTDKIHHAVEKGLTLYYSTPRQLRTARLMLYLYLISHYDQTRQRFTRFPNMDNIFQKRPPVLDSDRKKIYQAPPPEEDEWGSCM